MKCPICEKDALFVGVHDDEGNYHGLVGCAYESAPWSGLSYALHHEGWGKCPLCTDGAYSTMGGMLFDTAEEAIASLSALRPVSRGQVEEVWRGEWKCHGDCGVTECSTCGWSVEEYVGDYNFCPVCGAPMTDEAVEMVMERWKEAVE